MALFKDPDRFTRSKDSGFDQMHTAGETTPFSGIYRCEGCGHEIVSQEYAPLPCEQSHLHATNEGQIRWRLIVFAQHQK